MRAKAIQFVITALFASVASGQPPSEEYLDRVFHFTHTQTVQDLQEIATLIRSMTDIREASIDNEGTALALRGTAGQVALAEWLFHELDKPTNREAFVQQSQDPGNREYRVPGSGDDVVRLFYVMHAETARDVQEVATLVRSMAQIRRLFTYNAPRALALRGTAGQIAMAEWLFHELDRPRNRDTPVQQNPGIREYRVAGGSDDVVRVFYVMHSQTPREFQEIATEVRSKTQVRRLFTYNAPGAVVLRGTAAQMALAESLIKERDR